MGKSLRSKRMRANRSRKRIVNRPKELKKLKEALSFDYNEQTENAHLSMFNDIVNGPLPDDGTYFEPSVTVLEKSQRRYENFLSRKIPKIAEIASKNLKRPMEDPKKRENSNDDDIEVEKTTKAQLKPLEDLVLEGNECKPNKTGSWPKWMSQRAIKKAAESRRKRVKRITNREQRMNKSKRGNQVTSRKGSKQKTSSKTSPDVEMTEA